MRVCQLWACGPCGSWPPCPKLPSTRRPSVDTCAVRRRSVIGQAVPASVRSETARAFPKFPPCGGAPPADPAGESETPPQGRSCNGRKLAGPGRAGPERTGAGQGRKGGRGARGRRGTEAAVGDRQGGMGGGGRGGGRDAGDLSCCCCSACIFCAARGCEAGSVGGGGVGLQDPITWVLAPACP